MDWSVEVGTTTSGGLCGVDTGVPRTPLTMYWGDPGGAWEL